MTAKVCVRTHNAGECIRARLCVRVYTRASRLGRCYGHETVVYCAATGDLPMQTKPPRSPAISLYLAGCIALPTTTAWRALFIYTHARTHAPTPLFSSRYFSTPIFILSLISLP